MCVCISCIHSDCSSLPLTEVKKQEGRGQEVKAESEDSESEVNRSVSDSP